MHWMIHAGECSGDCTAYSMHDASKLGVTALTPRTIAALPATEMPSDTKKFTSTKSEAEAQDNEKAVWKC